MTEKKVKKRIEVLNDIEINVKDGSFDAEINKKCLCNNTDLAQLKHLWACKYVDSEHQEITYNGGKTRRQLNIENDLDLLKEKYLFPDLFKNGTNDDIKLIIATDTVNNKSIILDGLHRIITLYSMYLYKLESLNDLLFNRRFKIELTEINSKIAKQLFPNDFQM